MRKTRKLPRRHSLVLRFNDREQKAIEDYCKQYRISVRTKWIRELVMTEVIQRFERDSPTLFADEDFL